MVKLSLRWSCDLELDYHYQIGPSGARRLSCFAFCLSRGNRMDKGVGCLR
jgi:hypothetical protein